MPFLTPNQQCQSTELVQINVKCNIEVYEMRMYAVVSFMTAGSSSVT